MGTGLSHFWKRRGGRQQGSVAVEFAIIFPVLALLLYGLADFGHAWYLRHIMQNACKEGARYGTRFQADPATGDRVLPKNLNPSVRDYILKSPEENSNTTGLSLITLLPSDANPQVTLTRPAATESDIKKLPMEDLTVTLTARKTWFLIDKLVPGITSNFVDITVSTTMKCE